MGKTGLQFFICHNNVGWGVFGTSVNLFAIMCCRLVKFFHKQKIRQGNVFNSFKTAKLKFIHGYYIFWVVVSNFL